VLLRIKEFLADERCVLKVGLCSNAIEYFGFWRIGLVSVGILQLKTYWMAI